MKLFSRWSRKEKEKNFFFQQFYDFFGKSFLESLNPKVCEKIKIKIQSLEEKFFNKIELSKAWEILRILKFSLRRKNLSKF